MALTAPVASNDILRGFSGTPENELTDLGPLAWVLDELRKAVGNATRALRRFVTESDGRSGNEKATVDVGLLRTAEQQLHQAAGAMDMVDQVASGRILRAMETVVHQCVMYPKRCNENVVGCLERASFGLLQYLESVLHAKTVSSIALFPQYRDVQVLAGQDQRIHPADLWSTVWRWHDPVMLLDVKPVLYDLSVRTRFEQAILKLIKTRNADAARVLRDISLGFAVAQTARQPRVFWKLSAGFFEALSLGVCPNDIYVKRTSLRVLQQYSALVRGELSVSDQLAQQLVFFCAQAQVLADVTAPTLKAVQQGFGLESWQSVDYEISPFGHFDPTLLVQARKRIGAAKEAWSAVAGGELVRLRGLSDQFNLVADSLIKLHPSSTALAIGLTQAGDATVHSGLMPSAALAMEVATSVMFLEAAFEELDPADAQLTQRTARLAQRLQSVMSGGVPEPLEPWIETLYRKVSDRQTMGSVVGELRSALADLERLLDKYFHNPKDTSLLAAVPMQLSQMRGVLSVLGLDPAVRAVMRMRTVVEQLMGTDVDEAQAKATGTFDKLGNNLGALGLMFDMLNYQPMLAKKLFVFDEAEGELRSVMGRAVPQPQVEDDLPPQVSLVSMAPEVSDSLAQFLPTNFVSTDQHGWSVFSEFQPTNMVPPELGEPKDGMSDAGADTVPLLTESDALSSEFNTLLGYRPTQIDLPPSATDTVQESFGDSAVNLDEDDLLSIFLEEAREVVHSGIEAVQALTDNPSDLEHQTVLRRVFHTLKGSSRMVGLGDFGDAAWSFEQLHNTWLADRLPTTQELRELSQQALQGFSQWAQDIATGDAGRWNVRMFQTAADALRLDHRYASIQMPSSGVQTAQPMQNFANALQELPSLELDDIAPIAQPVVEAATLAFPESAPEPILPENTVQLVAVSDELWDPLAQTELDEQTKVIGDLRIGIPLYNVYLNEADEWSRCLLTELTEWELELHHRTLGESTVSLAHSLAGSSATVGFTALSTLARELEHALQWTVLQSQGTPEEGRVYTSVAEDIRRLLHQFAAGFIKEPNPEILIELRQLHAYVAAIPVAPAVPTVVQVMSPSVAKPIEPDFQVEPQTIDSAPQARTVFTEEPIFALDDEDIEVIDVLDPDLFEFFEEEANDLLPMLSGALRQWMARPDNGSARAEVLRVLHTLKGSARLAGAMRLGERAHRMETAVEQLDALGLSHEAVHLEALLARFDVLQTSFENLRLLDRTAIAATDAPIEVAGVPDVSPFESDAALAVSMDRSGMGADAGESPVTPAQVDMEWLGTAQAIPKVVTPLARPLKGIVTTVVRAAAGQAVRIRSQLLDRMVNEAGEVMMTRSRLEAGAGQLRASLGDLNANLERLRQQLRDIELQAELQMQSRMAQTKETERSFDPLEFDRFTRVQELTRMMAESVNDVATVQRNLQRTLDGADADLVAQARQTRELQRDLLRTRMLEFETIVERLYRVVRQAAKDTGKQVKLDITGGSIEMDRGVLDRMTPAFEHLLRNAVAHGVEAPAQRAAAGKPAVGTILIKLQQSGNDVSIAFSDDGAGLNRSRILDKALALGLIQVDQTLESDDLLNLIFTPGFSTATQVSELSGRGIGMDVVRSEVLALGGRIESSSNEGEGTVFNLVLPLTTAVTQVVMVRAGHASFGVPANVVEQVCRTPLAELNQAYTRGLFSFGGEDIPFFWSGALLQSSARSDQPLAKTVSVVVFRSAQQRLALHVDEVLGNQEVVVKNLGPQLSRLPGLSGMTVLASGAVVLIYNPVALASVYGPKAKLFQSTQFANQADYVTPVPVLSQVPLVLVVDDSITVRRVTQRLLQREGYRVVLAVDGIQALERLREEFPAVMLSDIEMPRMDGFELARSVRVSAAWKALPIITISSRTADKHRQLAGEIGINHYLGKPYGEEELLSLVRRYAKLIQADPTA
jgi:chemosensory pili system protein ChpA (sensor histidine kinase/response regulator)